MRNDGAMPGLPDDAVVETTAVVDASGAHPLPQRPLPPEMLGLVQHAKAYERLAVRAACSGSRDDVVRALLANPLVGQYPLAAELADELLAANRESSAPFLPVVNGGEAEGRRLVWMHCCAVCREDWSATNDPCPMTAATLPMTEPRRGVAPQPARVAKDRRQLPSWRWEELRTTLWVVPCILVVFSVLLFVVTFEIDLAAYHDHLDAAVLDPDGDGRRRAPGPHRHRRCRHHGRRRGVLHHDPGADAGVAAVRPADDAELRPRHRQPGHARRVRRDVRVLGACARSPSTASARVSSRTCPPRWPRRCCWSTSVCSSTSSTTSRSRSSCPRSSPGSPTI